MSHPYRSWTRRDFLKLAGRAGLLGAVPTLASAAAALEPDTICVSILHTTDLHGHILPTSDYDGTSDRGGLARCVTQIRRWRRQNPNSILVDVGDVYQGTEVSLRNKGELMIDLFNHLKYDAWVIGNHEFDWGIEPFTNALQKSAMPVLGANITLDGKPAGSSSDLQDSFAKVQPFVVKEIEGIKVAIIGITTPGMSFWLPREFTVGIDFQFPVESVPRNCESEERRRGRDCAHRSHGIEAAHGRRRLCEHGDGVNFRVPGCRSFHSRPYSSGDSKSPNESGAFHAGGPFRNSRGPRRSVV